jgi:ferric-dicitrate binding protein FerR (iron transport regulator)
VAEGPHVARREGETLVIEGQDDGFEMGPGFMFTWPQSRHRARRMRRHPGFRWGDVPPLRVRVNPDLPLDVDAQAGRLRISGVHGPIRANVQAGVTDISDFRSPLDLSVQAGSVTARGRLDHGASRVHCDAGSVRIHLERGSSVRVSAHTTLGKVRFDSGDARSPWVIGAGEGTLDIDGTMGSVGVSAD